MNPFHLFVFSLRLEIKKQAVVAVQGALCKTSTPKLCQGSLNSTPRIGPNNLHFLRIIFKGLTEDLGRIKPTLNAPWNLAVAQHVQLVHICVNDLENIQKLFPIRRLTLKIVRN